MKKAMKQSTQVLILNIASIVAIVLMVFLVFLYSSTNTKIDSANSDRFELTYNANRFMNGSAYLTNEVRAYAATGRQEHYDNYWNEINNLKNRDIGVAALKDIGITSAEQELIDEMSALSNTLVPLEEASMEDVAAGREQEAIEYVYGNEYSDSIAKINTLKTQFLETLDERAQSEVNRLIKISYIIRFLLYFALFVVVVLQLLNSYFVRKKLIHPIISVETEMKEISQGNLSAEFALESDTSEIGMLADAIHSTKRELKKYIGDISDKLSEMAAGNMNLTIDLDYQGEFLPIQDALRQILESLNRSLSNIDMASVQVSSGAEQVASGAQALSQGATQQAASVEELTSSIRELSEKLDGMAQNAVTASECSMQASSKLDVGNQKMSELTEAIGNIAQASSQISGIIKTIEDIAFQTNILALNAAVEAARAGSAGKGFAVVADEVRNLAAKSSDAAKDTTTLIENTLRLIDQGATLTDATTNALSEVVSGAAQSTQLVDEIAIVSKQQSDDLRYVMEGIEQISNVVQTNAATAQESAASAEELSGQADTLKESVKYFRLRP